MKTVSEEFVRELIDFAPTEETKRMGFADSQLEGATAGYNMLARNRIAYVADEVGMGKTYVALGIMGLVRYLNPTARIMILAPRENIQLKWIKELRNFTRFNWKLEDNRVKNLHGNPVRAPVACNQMYDLGHLLTASDHSDLFLRSSTFSLSMRDAEAMKRARKRIKPFVSWIDRSLLRARRDEDEFRTNFGRALNAIVPDIDLLVVDESHNFKKGFGPRVSNRNRLLGIALGHPMEDDDEYPWYGPRVKALLMLSATPFEYDYRDLYQQLDVFGKGKARVLDSRGDDPIDVRALIGDDEELKREATRRFLIRRVGYLNIAGKSYSKNLYRREWRHGGYAQHDDAMALDDPRERLTIGLVQKKVSEVLGDRRFNNSFQIGMLSSFESFLETLSKSRRLAKAAKTTDEEEEEVRVFDGDQAEEKIERQGIDTHSLESVIRSYREEFGRALPHPKLDATATHLRDVFESGEKSLVFVRRVATTAELKSKLDRHYDRWIRDRFEQELAEDMQAQVSELFSRYEREKRGEIVFGVEEESTPDDADKAELVYEDEDDEGGTDSFFAWFFRGEGPKGMLSGAAFQKNRLRATSSAYATMFEDNRVAWLLDYPDDLLAELGRRVGGSASAISKRLREEAWGYFRQRSKQAKGYPRLYVFEGYQVAALRLLVRAGGDVAERAQIILDERYLDLSAGRSVPPAGFPDDSSALPIRTFFTELAKRAGLRAKIWPEEAADNFRRTFRRREQRREMISAMLRLGASYVDLYLIAIALLGSFNLQAEGESESPVELLTDQFLDLLERQADTPGMHAFRELSWAAETFDVLLATNFPEVRDAALHQLATIYGRTLQHQSPVGRMAGTVNKRMIRQFRMPGYPLVLVTTDVLQEGEDLHTFCKNVIHYGITWTPSAMEQRTGRIDRIHSLVQRNLDGRARAPDPHEFIQVHYPHLADTVERLQVVRVMERLNHFLEMMHEPVAQERAQSSRVDVNRAALRKIVPPEPLRESLRSAFPVERGWMQGDLSASAVKAPDLAGLESIFVGLCDVVIEQLGAISKSRARPRHLEGKVAIRNGKIVDGSRLGAAGVREQPFELHMRSQVLGDATLIRCVSPVGELNLADPDVIDELYALQSEQGISRVCAHAGDRKLSMVTVERDRLFRMDTTQTQEIVELVQSVTLQADELESALLHVDRDWDGTWQHVEGEESENG